MSAARYGRAVGLWREAAGEDRAVYVGRPFVAAMGRGDPPKAAFLRYLRQECVFLIHFTRAWALAAVTATAEDMDELAGAVAAAHALTHEMPLHVLRRPAPEGDRLLCGTLACVRPIAAPGPDSDRPMTASDR